MFRVARQAAAPETGVMDFIPTLLINRFGDAMNAAVWPSRAGTGTVSCATAAPFEAQVHMHVGPNGEAWISLAPQQVPAAALPCLIDRNMKNVKVAGQFADGGRFESPNCFLEQFNFQGGEGAVYATAAQGMEIRLNAPPKIECVLIVMGATHVTHRGREDSKRYRVVYTLVNAVFDGIDWSEFVEDGKTQRRADHFTFAAAGRRWTLRWLPNYDKGVKAKLTSGLWKSAATATLETSDVDLGSLDALDREMDSICWLLDAATGCQVAAPVRQIINGEMLVEERAEPRIPHSPAASTTHYELISNHEPATGLKQFLETTVGEFLAQRDTLRLTDYLGWMNQVRTHPVIEVKTVTSVLAIELISFVWCTTHGITPQQAELMNIEQKLNRMRKDGMHFIDKKFTATDLRGGLRNPLMHTGLVPLMTHKELQVWSADLYHLAYRILLYVLRYKGQYRDPTQDYKLVDAP